VDRDQVIVEQGKFPGNFFKLLINSILERETVSGTFLSLTRRRFQG
ncbi:MAG: hypothetical protein HW373_1133, partial [Deltaproteobacteria bacterium]|nr:hypothetical protein [Deltaproteobacteria bacterium]